MLAGVAPAAGENFGNALLMKQQRADQDEADAFEREQFDFRRQQHADALRQTEVDRANKMLGLDAGPVNFNVKEPTPPSTFEGAAARLLSEGIGVDDPRFQALMTAEGMFNPEKPEKPQAQPDIVSKFLGDISGQQATYDKAVQDAEFKGFGSSQSMPPRVTIQPPNAADMWWRKYAPMAQGAGLNVDSIRALLAPAYPELNADRRPGVNRQPTNSIPAYGNPMLQGLNNAMQVGGADMGGPPPNDGSMTDEQYQAFVRRWYRGEYR
ncbi:MAG: hypothetical protein AB1664_00745 [Thermodesulfobacteriota bacterium]